MSISASDILLRLSGGTGNTNQDASLGGAASTSTNASGSLFDNVSSAEATAGDVEYRCFYVENNHGSLTFTSAKIFIQTNTPDSDTTLDIGLGTSGINGTEQTVANENTAPTGVTFSAPTDYASGLSLGDLAPGDNIAVWVRRTVNAAAAAYNDNATLRIQGDTLA